MRLIARFPDQKQAAALVDSLRSSGFDRKDMIISDLADEGKYKSVENAAEELVFVKSESDGVGEYRTFKEEIKGLRGKEGIVVAVQTPKHESDRVRAMMEQSGAVEIIED